MKISTRELSDRIDALQANLDAMRETLRRMDRDRIAAMDDDVLAKVCEGIADDIDISAAVVVPGSLGSWKESYFEEMRMRIGA